MIHCTFRANIALWIVVELSCGNILELVSTLMDIGLTLTCHMVDSSYDCVNILKVLIPNVVTLLHYG